MAQKIKATRITAINPCQSLTTGRLPTIRATFFVVELKKIYHKNITQSS